MRWGVAISLSQLPLSQARVSASLRYVGLEAPHFKNPWGGFHIPVPRQRCLLALSGVCNSTGTTAVAVVAAPDG